MIGNKINVIIPKYNNDMPKPKLKESNKPKLKESNILGDDI